MADRTHVRLPNPDSNALQIAFFAAFPRIARHAQIYFRGLKCVDTRDDAVAESVALAWVWFVRLVERGKHPETFISAIATFAARAVRDGRRMCGKEKAKDVLSRTTQVRRGFSVSRFPEFSTRTDNVLDEALQDNTATPVPDQVSFRLDFPAWLATRSIRDRELIGELIVGERSQDAARRFGVSPARIAQLRRAYLEDWRAYCDEPV